MSRKTTQAAISAFLKGDKLTTSNTTTDGVNLYLFGNKIAEKRKDGIYISNAGWFSATTKDRLNGLPNVSLYQKDKVWYLNDKEWNGEWTKIPS